MFLSAIKNWIKEYIRENIGEWIKDILQSIITKITEQETKLANVNNELAQVNTKLDNDYSVLSELAGEDYPDKAKALRESDQTAVEASYQTKE